MGLLVNYLYRAFGATVCSGAQEHLKEGLEFSNPKEVVQVCINTECLKKTHLKEMCDFLTHWLWR